jgi:hypothetical protein
MELVGAHDGLIGDDDWLAGSSVPRDPSPTLSISGDPFFHDAGRHDDSGDEIPNAQVQAQTHIRLNIFSGTTSGTQQQRLERVRDALRRALAADDGTGGTNAEVEDNDDNSSVFESDFESLETDDDGVSVSNAVPANAAEAGQVALDVALFGSPVLRPFQVADSEDDIEV